ncbi:MAG: outer membrane protein assembly factor BamA [bacterium]
MTESHPRRSLMQAALFALALAPLVGLAQSADAPLEPKVRSVKMKSEGGTASEQFVLGYVSLRPGQTFSREAVTNSIRALYATGRFNQASIVPQLDPKTGEVDLIVTVEPRPVIAKFEYIGGEGLFDKDADDRFADGLRLGEPLDSAALRRAEIKLQTEIRKKRPFTLVSSQTYKDKNSDGVVVSYVIKDGAELRVDNITIDGATAFTVSEITAGAELKGTDWRWWKFSWLLSSGRLDPEDYRADCKKILEFYRARGYLDVQIEEQDPEKVCTVKDIEDGKGWVDVVFKVKEGRCYTVGDVTISGNVLGETNPVFNTENLQKVVSEPALRRGAYKSEVDHFVKGETFVAAAMDTASEKIKEYYGQMGYLNAQVSVERKPNLETGVIDVRYKIEEGMRFTVRAIEIQGNTKTRSKVIARELALSPGEVFDLARARVSEARLRNTQFFEEVRVVPAPTPVPGQSDLRVIVKEGPTGSVSFGAGYSTVEQLVGFVEYSEGNFDASNPEGWYRGAGQKFRLRVSLGSVSSSLEHSFEEPSLWDRDLAVGYKIERRYTGYQSSNYSVVNEGIGVYARRRLFGAVEGRLAYDLRRVTVDNVLTSAPAVVQLEAGKPKIISSITASLVKDTRDEYNFPTKGVRLSLSEEIAGLGGDLKYLRSELRTGKWFLISPTSEQTLALIGRLGMVTGSGTTLPFYERFYLGGAYDMRGFGYNEVGAPGTWDTVNGNQPIGGLTYGYLSAEYTIKAADNLRFATFYDYGVVNEGSAAFGLSSANSDWGLGMRILLGGSVMRLDFGFPLKTTKDSNGTVLNGGGTKFNFSFGTVF